MRFQFSIYLIIFSSIIFAQSPGGVGGVDIWYKADVSIDTDLSYTDYSGNRQTITTDGEEHQPSYGLWNYNETLLFDGQDDFLHFPYRMQTLDKISLFTVYQNANSELETAIFTSESAGEKKFFLSTKNVFRYNDQALNYINTETINTVPSFSQYAKFDLASSNVQYILGAEGGSILYLGKEETENNWGYFQGKIPEFIWYRKILTQNERQRVNTYLALKYAVTMPYTKYLSSKSKTIWKEEDFTVYPHHIAGIVRDNHSGLYQKQASSSSEEKRLIIALNELTETNKENTGVLSDQTFFIWGNNTGDLILEDNVSFQLLKRRWKSRFSSETTNEFPNTEVVFKISDIIPEIGENETIWLMIDRSGENNFNSTDINAYPVNFIDEEGNAHFNHISFDTDHNSVDVFSFALGNKILATHELTQPTCQKATGSFSFNLVGGQAPFQLTLTSDSGTVQELTTQSFPITIGNLSPDHYVLQVLDANGNNSNIDFQITNFDDISIDLGENQTLPSNGYITLDASSQITDSSATYHWSSENGFSSDEAIVNIYESGIYSVTVNTSDGCSKSDTIEILPNIEKGIWIYPNPVLVHQDLTIKIRLENPEDVTIRLYDMSGKLLKVREEKGQSSYDIKEQFYVEGAYLVSVNCASYQKTFKVIAH